MPDQVVRFLEAKSFAPRCFAGAVDGRLDGARVLLRHFAVQLLLSHGRCPPGAEPTRTPQGPTGTDCCGPIPEAVSSRSSGAGKTFADRYRLLETNDRSPLRTINQSVICISS